MIQSKKRGWIGFFLCASLWGAPYTDNGNGTVTDSGTGLVWQKCSAGLGTTLGNCNTGSIGAYSWSSAISYCEGLTLGGRSDWRLPNINELGSIVDDTKSYPGPTIDSTAFPNTQSGIYRSSSTFTQDTRDAWFVHFNSGSVGRSDKLYSYTYDYSSYYYVRCVTGP